MLIVLVTYYFVLCNEYAVCKEEEEEIYVLLSIKK